MKITKTALFIVSILLLSSGHSWGQKELTLKAAIMEQYGEFYPESLNQLQWIPQTSSYSYVEDNTLISAPVGRVKKNLVTLDQLNSYLNTDLASFPRISWKDEREFEFTAGLKRFSFNTKTKEGKSTYEFNEGSRYGKANKDGNAFAYTIENNLFVQLGKEIIQITDHPSHIVAGSAYARQEFGITEGIFWSGNGESIAFYEKDEINVADYPLLEYNQTPASVRSIKYPMAGGSSEIPSVGIYNIKSKNTVYLNLENGKKDDSFYATNLAWGPGDKYIYLAIVQRDQKQMWLKKYDVKSGQEVATLFTESNEKYVEPENPPIFIEGKDQFLWFSERNDNNNLFLYDTEGNLKGQTSFDFPITSFIGFSEKNKKIFVQATGARAIDNQIFSVDLPSMKTKKISRSNGQHFGMISTDGKYIIDNWTSIDTPRKIDILDSNGNLVEEILTADDPLKDYGLAKPEIFELPTFDDTKLWCRMIKPSDFDESKKYPVLVYTYNGPHVQLVKDRYLGGASLWMYRLAEEGYIVFTVDGRGSLNRGFEFESTIHGKVGQIEVRDQAYCTQWLKDQPFTDENKFAVHGWSYGGFMTTSLMLKNPGLFQVGVGGGPVIDWRFYEVMYTERYMDTPETNPIGFETSDLKNYVENLDGDLLLIHGVIDDVVVMQHNMSFQKACIDKGVQVDFYAYPGHAHNVRGIDRVHLMTKVLDYIKLHLD